MIISAKIESCKSEFEKLLSRTVDDLINRSKKDREIISLYGRNFEPIVKDVMSNLAIGTPFENSIELISGQKFPDIVAKKYFGVEVKTTSQNHWKTTGNSVLESTRVEDVERIYLLFAKLSNPIEFKCRKYEEVLSEVVVTHSPRYLIDMNLEPGMTIFDKINIPYDVLRKKENPIRPIVDYYKSMLKNGEELWWIDNNNSNGSNFILKNWNNLNPTEKLNYKTKAMIYFPELFGNSNNKFGKLAVWLVTKEALICPNIRDAFTAGGKELYSINSKNYDLVPRVFVNLFDNYKKVIDTLSTLCSDELSEYWNCKTSDDTKLYDWIDLVESYSKGIKDAQHLNIKKMLLELIFEKK